MSFDGVKSNEKAKTNSKQPSKPSEAENLKKDFECKMSDDLHTAEILKGSLQDALKAINNELNGLKVSVGGTCISAPLPCKEKKERSIE